MGVVRHLDKLREPQASTEGNHDNPMSGTHQALEQW